MGRSKANIITNNIKIDGTDNGYGTPHSKNDYGIMMDDVMQQNRNITTNNMEIENNNIGIGSYNSNGNYHHILINNSDFFNNKYGVRVL